MNLFAFLLKLFNKEKIDYFVFESDPRLNKLGQHETGKRELK